MNSETPIITNETPAGGQPVGGGLKGNLFIDENNIKPEASSQTDLKIDPGKSIAEKVEQRVAAEWPELQPLPKGLPPVEAFDFRLLPITLEPWARDICERIQCPPDYVGVAVMVALGAVIGRKIGIRPQGETDWTVIPNMWGALIGRPGVLKSPAMEAALGPLKRLEAQAMEKYQEEQKTFVQRQLETELRLVAVKKKASKKLESNPNADLSDLICQDENPAPILKRYKTNDSTAEALGDLMRQNPNGLLVFRDELVSLLKNLERDEKSEARGFYLTGWNGDSSYVFDRIGRGLNLYIPAVCLSLLGSTQPGKIAHYVRSALNGGFGDDGMIQRFNLTVWPDTDGKWVDVDRPPDSEAKNVAFQIFSKLDGLFPAEIGAEQDKDFNGNPDGIPYLRFAPDALELFREWRKALEDRLRSGELHPAMESHLAKYRKLVPGLALIIHLSNGDIGKVTRGAALKALAWADYLETHANRLYASVTAPEISAAELILKKLRAGALESPFPGWKIWRAGWSGLTDRDVVKDALHLLVDYGWLRMNQKYTGGRPSEEYEVNPKGVAV